MVNIQTGGRDSDKLNNEALFIREGLIAGINIFRAGQSAPDDLIARLKDIGVNAEYSPVYAETKCNTFICFSGFIRVNREQKNLIGYEFKLTAHA